MDKTSWTFSTVCLENFPVMDYPNEGLIPDITNWHIVTMSNREGSGRTKGDKSPSWRLSKADRFALANFAVGNVLSH